MKLTSFSNYCMRVLMVAAARGPVLTTIREVSASFGISDAHVVKCVHQLGSWGYLETVRGNKGGFRLAVPAAEINVGAIIRRTEEAFLIVECFDAKSNMCRLIDICKLRLALIKATEAFLSVLDDLTLAELTAHGTDILEAIRLAPVSNRAQCEFVAQPG
ncbi:RrF2 family transcriptional regulator [Oryzibacter oryziterrae]|uniref:RrF2 family transcriptional regulator n=1 Tax=Oryzibacter oryziterrae TaxID=2766474 RepID=UPI001F3F1BD1|nr:Rrf2 family transcriptional regulator [Oryzibacter oryziterrae]